MNRIFIRAAAFALAVLPLTASYAQTPPTYSGTRTSSFTYFPSGVLEREKVEPDTPNLCVDTRYGYDSWGNKTTATTAKCDGASGNAVFDPRASNSTYGTQTVTVAGVASVVIPAGQFATSASNALNQSETRIYDPRFGTVTSLTGPNGLTTSFSYDDFGRKTGETRADDTRSELRYCLLSSGGASTPGVDTSANSPGCTNAPLSGIGAEVPATAVSYVQSLSLDANGVAMGPAARAYKDAQGRTVREVTEAFDGGLQPGDRRYVAKDTFYNPYGVAYLSTAPYFLGANSSTLAGSSDMGLSLTTVDALGRPVQMDVADPQGNVSGVAFGSLGTRTAARTTISYSGLNATTTNPKGQTRTEEKNADGKLVRVTDGFGAQLVHQHDAFGNLIQTRDPLGNTLRVSYDTRGRKTSMADPDTGTWNYAYNALGELVWQQSPNQLVAGTATTMVYDVLGRMTSRSEPEYLSSWTYDACNKGVGKLCESNTSHGVNKKIVYDSLGRPVNSRTTVSSGPSFATALEYEPATGRVLKQTYPTGVAVQFAYSSRGFVTQVQLATAATVSPLPATPGGTPVAGKALAAGTALWTAGTVNAWGKAETQSVDSGVVSRATFEPSTGRVTALSAGIASATNVLNHGYTWDSLNNLASRVDHNGDGNTGAVNESFVYDSINRLTRYTVNAPQVPNLQRVVDLYYNAVGNLLYKSDVGNYEYPEFGTVDGTPTGVQRPQPHAVARIVGTSFGTVNYRYDANGNMFSADGGKYRSVSYTSFNLPDSNTGMAGAGGSPRYTWQYDENHQRIKEVRVNGSGTRTTWFQHPDNQGGLSFESDQSPSGVTSNRHYVSAGGQTIVLVTSGALPVLGVGAMTPPSISSVVFVKLEVWHKDHLGSLAATTDHLGNVTARYAYDPFGKRRMTNGSYDAFGTVVVDWADNVSAGTDRGYTGHEHLDDLGVVHMNGRIFDPTIARFMQGDPFVQDPGNLQNYDRFAYCFNNPLTCTDPSGYFSFKKFLKIVAVVVVSYVTAGAATQWLLYNTALGCSMSGVAIANALGAAVGGFASGAIAGGSFKSGMQGAFSGALFSGVGYAVGDAGLSAAGEVVNGGRFAEAIALHGIAGCISGVASGGRCGPSALSAAFSKAALPVTTGFEDGLERAFAHAVVGGTASVLGGGRFANGAQTGAFSYLFNYCSQATAKCFAAWAKNLGKIGLGGLGMFGGSALCTTVVGCALGSVGVVAGAANVYEGTDWVFNRNESTDGVNPIKRAITTAVPSANADLAFASMEVLGGGLALKAPIILKDELWFTIYGIQRVPGLPITVPASALPQGAFDAAGAAWDGANAAMDQAKKKRP